jgi:uncharacterized protein (TIGR03067 family)
MKSFAALLLLASVSYVAPLPDASADDKAADQELAKLKGTWKIVSYEKDGVQADANALDALPTLTFDGRKYTWSDGEEGSIEAIDPTKKPKSIDYKAKDEDGKDRTDLAIYDLDGDTFRDCISAGGQERPKEFTAKKGTGNTLVTYKRVK